MERTETKPKNPYSSTSVIFLILALISIFLIFLPSLLDMDMMKAGFGISFIAVFFAISFFITSIVYFMLARRLNNIFSSDKVLAHWKYGAEEWKSYSSEEFKRQKKEKWQIFILIAAVTIIVGGIFILAHRDAWKVLSAVFAGLLFILALVAFIIPEVKYAKDSRQINPEAYISTKGIYLAGEFYVWNFLSSRLDEIMFDESKMIITVNYSYTTRTGLNSASARIPVPVSRLEEARAAVHKLKNNLK